MPPRALFAGLEHWKVFSPGFRLALEEPSGPVQHSFCGAHHIRGAWCFHGDHPLLRLLTLDATDEQLGLNDLGLSHVHLLYCWRCDVGELDYRLENDGSVTVFGEQEWRERLKQLDQNFDEVRARLRQPDTDYPYREYPMAFPLRAARLVPLDPDEQQALLSGELERDLRSALAEPRHQVGGLPYLVQGTHYVPACPGCGDPMAFLATIADDCADPRGFVGNEYVQVVVFLCAKCRRVHALNMCD